MAFEILIDDLVLVLEVLYSFRNSIIVSIYVDLLTFLQKFEVLETILDGDEKRS